MNAVGWQSTERISVWHRLLAVAFAASVPVAIVIYQLHPDERYPVRTQHLHSVGVRFGALVALWMSLAAGVALGWDRLRKQHRILALAAISLLLLALLVGGTLFQRSAMVCACSG